jgi:hypothetical protein
MFSLFKSMLSALLDRIMNRMLKFVNIRKISENETQTLLSLTYIHLLYAVSAVPRYGPVVIMSDSRINYKINRVLFCVICLSARRRTVKMCFCGNPDVKCVETVDFRARHLGSMPIY